LQIEADGLARQLLDDATFDTVLGPCKGGGSETTYNMQCMRKV